MANLPQLHDLRRPARLRLADSTPAVLRFPNGGCTTAELQVVSISGGLLNLLEPVEQGSATKLLFLTPTGPVMGDAEMLGPLTRRQQPFRFVSLHYDDLCRLETTIQSSLHPRGKDQDEWIAKYRAAVNQPAKPRRRFVSILGAFGLGLLCLGSTLYVLHYHLLK